MTTYRILLFPALLSCFILQLAGQAPHPYDPLPKLIPQTPEAAALQRFGETDVDLFKGETSISIPIYTLSTKGINVPVYLSYNAGGFRVSELSTNVGLGWNLNYGGMISQNIRDRNDMTVARRRTPDIQNFIPTVDHNGVPNADYITAIDIMEENDDTEPDIFHFNFLGRSGKFLFNDSLNHIYTIPHEKLEIEFLPDSSWFTIKDENGMLYYFTSREISIVTQQCDLGFANPRDIINTHVTNWYLTKIKHPFGDSVVFVYEANIMRYREGISETRYKYLPTSNCGPHGTTFISKESVCTRIMNISAHRIKKIISGGIGEIEFYYVNPRLDVDYYEVNSAKSLDSIIIRNNDRKINKFIFTYNYFAPSNIESLSPEDQPLNRRLKLTRLTDESTGDYVFKYNESMILPNRLSNSQDKLGYANGTNTNGTFIPCGIGFQNCKTRDINLSRLQTNVLQDLTYPTGGKTKFIYEPHESQKIDIVYDTTYHISTLEADPQQLIADTFYVPASQYDYLEVSWVLPEFPDRLDGISRGSITEPDSTFTNLHLISDTGKMLLPRQEGFYRLIINNFSQHLASARITIKAIDTITSSEVVNTTYHSGLRIKEIIDSAGFNSGEIKRQFSYVNPATGLNQFNDLRMSSFVENISTRHCDSETGEIYYCDFARYTGSSVSPYGIENDNQFGYKHVRIYYDTALNGGRGYEEYKFAIDIDDIDSIGAYMQNFHFGKLLQKDTYKFDAEQQAYSLLQRESNRYAFLVDENDFYNNSVPSRFVSRNEAFIPVMKLQYLHPEQPVCNTDLGVIPAEFQIESYIHSSFSHFQNKSETTLFSTEASFIKKTQLSFYDNPKHDRVTRTISVSSSGDTIINTFKYKDDYLFTTSNDPTVRGLINLNAKHVIANPIETITYLKKPNGNLFVVNGTLTTYKPNIHVQDSFFVLELPRPLPANEFVSSYVNGNGNFVKDARYKIRAIIGRYDASGNVVEQQKSFDVKSSYIWDYQSEYPIAECRNADSANIAYTSFEADGSGNWTIAGSSRSDDGITGKKCYQLSNGAISKNNLSSATEYIVTYWTNSENAFSISGTQGNVIQGRSVGDWKCFMHRVTGVTTINISGTAIIDELRLYPKGAQMSTYTFEPLIGITSQCDVANKVAYYEYDSFGRLKLIRDQDKNILKTFDYKYQANTNQ
jgi:hypothetical protein